MGRKGKEKAQDIVAAHPDGTDVLAEVAQHAGIPQADTAKALFSLMAYINKDNPPDAPASSPSATAGSPGASSSVAGQPSNVMNLMQSLARFAAAEKRPRPSSNSYHPQPTRSGRVPAPVQGDVETVFDLEKYIDFPSDSDSDDEDFLPQASNSRKGRPNTRSRDGAGLRTSEADDMEDEDEFVPESDNTLSGDEEIVTAYNLVAPIRNHTPPSQTRLAPNAQGEDSTHEFDPQSNAFPIDFGYGPPSDLSNIAGIMDMQPLQINPLPAPNIFGIPQRGIAANPFQQQVTPSQASPVVTIAHSPSATHVADTMTLGSIPPMENTIDLPEVEDMDIEIEAAAGQDNNAEDQATAKAAESSNEAGATAKRGRGRPRKNPLPDQPKPEEVKPKVKRKIIPPELRAEARLERNRRLAKENAARKKRNLAEAQDTAAKATEASEKLETENSELRKQVQDLQNQVRHLQQLLLSQQANSNVTARPLQSLQGFVNGEITPSPTGTATNAGRYLDKLVQSWQGQ